jgi:hypothetical protein
MREDNAPRFLEEKTARVEVSDLAIKRQFEEARISEALADIDHDFSMRRKMSEIVRRLSIWMI